MKPGSLAIGAVFGFHLGWTVFGVLPAREPPPPVAPPPVAPREEEPLAEAFGILARTNPCPSAHDAHPGVELSSRFRAWGGAVYAVQELRERGTDTSAFGDLLPAPVLALEAPDRKSLHPNARYAIEYHEVTWSERAARALEAAGIEKVARRIRAKPTSPWKDE